MISILNLYSMPSESIEHDLYLLNDQIPEADISFINFGTISSRVEIRIIKEFHFDHKRLWRMASVWMDGIPVMIIQNAGRSGFDHKKRFVTNKEKFIEMIAHIRSLVTDVGNVEIVLETYEADDLIKFYGSELGGYFSKGYY